VQRAGQILLELDSDITRTDQQAQAKLEGLQNREALELVKTNFKSNQPNSTKFGNGLIPVKAYALENRLHLAKKDMQRHRYLWQQGVISRN